MKTALTIAGSDSSGGAGIQADLKTMCALGVFGMSVITAITAQNTQKVYDVREIDPAMVSEQIDAVFIDIPPDAVKIGMVSNAETMRVIRDRLLHHHARNIVLDPVIMSKSGCRLIDKSVERELTTLFPIAAVVTPNFAEAEALTGRKLSGPDDMVAAAREIRRMGAAAVMIKAGPREENCDDLLLLGDEPVWLREGRVSTDNTHGSGCTLSSAIACRLAAGSPLRQAVEEAKAYVTQAIKDALAIGHGVGPLGHLSQLYRKAGVE